MLRFDTTKRMVHPYFMAIQTTPRMLHRAGLSGLGQDDGSGNITLPDVINWATSAFQNYTQASNISDMVNQINAALSRLSAQYQQLKANNQLSLSVINQYETAVRNLLSNFCNFTLTQGTAGQVGCQEVTTAAQQLIQSFDLDKATLGVFGGGNLPLLLIGGAVLWFLIRR